MTARVLVIDDDPDIGRLVGRTLARAGMSVAVHRSGELGLAALLAEPFDLVVSDVRMDGLDGVELCRRVVDNLALPVVLLTAHDKPQVLRAAVRAGAADLVVKPFAMSALTDAVARALAARAGPGNRRLPAPDGALLPRGLVGSSLAWRRVMFEVQRVATSDATVLVVGESGTGKERIARALHEASPRRHEPFVAVHCAAVPATLLETELFGHERGAFTGAARARRGLFAEAGRGTLFLDDVGAMPVQLQPKLLRAIQGRTVRPVGSTRETPFEARIIAATNVDLAVEASEGRFRADLLYRLDVLRVELPALRERGADVVDIARSILAELAPAARLSPAAEAQLLRYPWPGNVRELRNCIESAAAFADGDSVELSHLPADIQSHDGALPILATSVDTLAAVERAHITRVLGAVGGNRSAAAEALGISRQALYRKLHRLGLE